MSWTQGLTAAVGSVGVVSLVAVGVSFVVDTGPAGTSVTSSVPSVGATSTERWVAASPFTAGEPLVTAPVATVPARPAAGAAAPAALPAKRGAAAGLPRRAPGLLPDPGVAAVSGAGAGRSLDPASAAPEQPVGEPPTYGPAQEPAQAQESAQAQPTAAVPAIAASPASSSGASSLNFALTTFNVLGASHTARGGTHPKRASGRVRAARAAVVLARHRSDIVGFQELQGSQLAALRQRTNLDFYPGSSLGPSGGENSLGWRRDRFVAVEKHTVSIPYFNGGARQMPYVRLRSRSTGVEGWFANFHNPADTKRFHRQGRFRLRATRIESALVNRLTSTGLPVFVTGDMNEAGSYFCRLTSTSALVAARGGTNRDGTCRPTRSGTIDWILGSQGVRFTGYDEDRSHLVDITTDHPVVTAEVHVVGADRRPRRR